MKPKILIIMLIIPAILLNGIRITQQAAADESKDRESRSTGQIYSAEQYEQQDIYLPIVSNRYEDCPVYSYLDCRDIQRIQREIDSGTTQQEWLGLQAQVDDFLQNHYPTTYNNTDNSILYWGGVLNNQALRDIALVYLVTGEEPYGLAIVDLIDLIVANTPPRDPDQGPESGLYVNPTDGEFTVSTVIFAYSSIRNSSLLTAEQRQRFDDFFYTQSLLWEEWAAQSFIVPTWLSAYISDEAVAMIALSLGDDARFDDLFNRAHDRIAVRLRQWFDGDGEWIMKSDCYSPLVFTQILLYAEALLKNTGENLYSVDLGGKTIQNMCERYVKTMTPLGHLPALNDGGWVSPDLSIISQCASRYGSPEIAFAAERLWWGLNNLHDGGFLWGDYYFHRVAWADSSRPSKPPEWNSTLMPETGLAVLRSDWSFDAQYMLLQFTETDQHQHYSFGNIVLYDQGLWMLDNGYQLFTNGVRDYALHTRSMSAQDHSTLTMDDQTHEGNGGTADYFADLRHSGIASIHGRTYPHFWQIRTVLWAKPWHQWLVVDEPFPMGWMGRDEPPHTYQLRWYASSDAVSGGGSHWDFSVNNRDMSLDFLLAYVDDTQVISRTYPSQWFGFGSSWGVQADISDRHIMATLITLPLQGENNPGLTNVWRWDPGGLILFSSNKGTQNWIWLYAGDKVGLLQREGYGILGRAGWVLIDSGTLAGYGIFEGKDLTYQDQSLVKSDQYLSIDANYTDNEIGVAAPVAASVELYWPMPITSVVDENGAAVDYSLMDGGLSIDVLEGEHIYYINH